jgi:hypothetical protein
MGRVYPAGPWSAIGTKRSSASLIGWQASVVCESGEGARHLWFASTRSDRYVVVLRIAFYLIVCVGGLLVALVGGAFAWFAVVNRPRRRREAGFEYVWINDDGSARELEAEECKHLTTKFHPTEGGRPHIKFWYESKTPEGRLSGFLRRRQVPVSVPISPA